MFVWKLMHKWKGFDPQSFLHFRVVLFADQELRMVQDVASYDTSQAKTRL